MLIAPDVLLFLQTQFADVPLRAPKRIEFITEQVNVFIRQRDRRPVYVNFNVAIPSMESSYFTATYEHVNILSSKLPRNSLNFSSFGSGVKVLMPNQISCCPGKFRVDQRPSHIIIYGTNGILNALYYHARCAQCKTTYYYNFKDHENNRQFEALDLKSYFVLASGVGFSIDLLNHVSRQITIGSVSFQKLSEIYNNEHSLYNEQILQSKILQNNWLLYRLVSELNTVVVWDRKETDSCYHTEKICLQVYPAYKELIDNRWLPHVCNEVGCRKRFIVCDGNEKLYRYSCSQPISGPALSRHNELYSIKRCINNPIRGNQNVNYSKLCHLHVTGKAASVTVTEQIDHRPATRNYVKNLTVQLTSGEGCKSSENLNKFEYRTAGMFYVLRPCGIRLSHFEMYTAESLSMVASSLIDIFGDDPKATDITGVVYDRACDLSPYLQKQSAEGNTVVRRFSSLRYIVDIFHCERHTMPKCVISSGECKFHPDLPEFADVRAMNMEVCEQSFHLLNPYKHITRNMTYAKRLCFLKILDNDYNTRLEAKQFRKNCL